MRVQTSQRVFNVYVRVPEDLTVLDFALRTPNSIVAPALNQRCTCHGVDFTVSMSRSTRLPFSAMTMLLFSPTIVEAEVARSRVADLFRVGLSEVSASICNWVTKYYTGKGDIDLDDMFDDMHGQSDVFGSIMGVDKDDKNKLYTERLHMDRQSICALIVKPFPDESNVKLEIYHTGQINVAGLTTPATFERFDAYIRARIVPMMAQHSYA